MCGIFGYVGVKNATKIVLSGLKQLEYRGYDSSGIAGIRDGRIQYTKEVGKIAVLEAEINRSNMFFEQLAIGQTRWATHGKPNRINAHPHIDGNCSLAVVHNGIIENHEELRNELKEQGVTFVSETDTEVIAHLISHLYEGDLLEALHKTSQKLQGAYAIALIHVDYPDHIFGVAQESPLVIGIGENAHLLASDSLAFMEHADKGVFLAEGEIAVVRRENYEIYTKNLEPVERVAVSIAPSNGTNSKGNYEHYTLKEIHEQPQVVSDALCDRLMDDEGTAFFEEMRSSSIDLIDVEKVLIIACGTSWNAGYVASYIIEEQARIPVQLEIASEFRYKNAVVLSKTLIVAISQSGETADTLAAVRELRARGAKVIALCNVLTSTLAREADLTLPLRAGPEIGVCSTKAFTNQLVVLSLLSLILARARFLTQQQGQKIISGLRQLPLQIQQLLDHSSAVAAIAKKYAHFNDFFFLGRHYMFPTSLEGALKLKEISYINANGYPAGEMKHGPIALINDHCPTVALCANKATFTKLQSNLMEVRARSGAVIAIAEKDQDVSSVADDVIYIPVTLDSLAPILVTIVTQLFAYYVAKERKTDIDQPRNLAKSVSVE